MINCFANFPGDPNMAGRSILRKNAVKIFSTLCHCYFAVTLLIALSAVGFAQAKPERQSKAVKPNQATTPTASAADQDVTAPDAESTKPEEKPFKGMKYR